MFWITRDPSERSLWTSEKFKYSWENFIHNISTSDYALSCIIINHFKNSSCFVVSLVLLRVS